MKKRWRYCVASLLACVVLASCTTYTTRVENAPGRPTMYEDPGSPGAVQGIGIESQDLVSMTDRMLRDMMTNPMLAGRATPPRVIVDAEYFHNEGSEPINLNLITDRLRVGLNRAANGRMVFVARHHASMAEKERLLKREGVVDTGTKPLAAATAGGDYRLGGRVMTLDSIDANTGTRARYHQITFEMMDLETLAIVWAGTYEFRKSAQDDVIYR